MIVRWLWARDEASVVEAIRSIPETAWVPSETTLHVPPGGILLFEAALRGVEATRASLEIFMTPGRYAVSTANVEPNEDTCLIVHRFNLLQ